jgi:predicted RNA-binding protein with TRAM domain
VAGVEVSTDGGSTWHPANGTTNWSYTWTAHGSPSTTIKWRAVDDSGNLQVPGAGVTVNVNCPCSMWATSVTPSVPDAGDTQAVEVGVKFKSDTFGTVSGIRFYKSAGNTGTHSGSLWTADGTRLAQVTFSGESASGWQTATFSSPVAIQPNTTYIASYFAPSGHYAATQDYFWRAPAPGPNGGATTDSAPLHALHNDSTTGNGVYGYGASSVFPTNTFGAANYWVDVVFSSTPPPGQVTNVTATTAGRTSANVTWSAPTTGGSPTSYKITPFVGSTPQTPKTISGSPPATSTTVTGLTTGTTYTFTVQAINPNGSGPASAQSNSVTPSTAVVPTAPTAVAAQPASLSARVTWTAPDSDGDSAITGYTVTPYVGSTAQTPVQAAASATSATVTGLTNGTSYTFKVTATNGVGTSPSSAASNAVTPQSTIFDFAAPTVTDSGDTGSVELGVKFKADFDGFITGIRFYKASANIGTHIGSLWSAAGTRLAQVTFANETASGWQTATFATPVAVTAGTTYVASYFAPTGRYSYTANGLSSAVDNPPLHALGNSTSSNGVYAYGSSSTFPSNSYEAANYFVDAMYALPAPGQVTGVSASAAGSTSANLSWTAPSSGGPVTSYKITPYVGTTAQAPTTITGSPPATSKKITGLTTGTTYTFTVQAVNANGSGTASAQSNAVTPTAAVVPSAPTGVAAQPATRSARVTWNPSDSDGDSPITGYTVTPYIGSTAQTPMTVSASATSATVTGLTNGTSYTFKVVATNAIGNSQPSAASNAAVPRATIFDFATPSTVDSGDVSGVELGVKFTAETSGSIAGVRFYKASANTGTHIGSLWTAAGTRLAQATFTSETASGWQTVTFSSPVAITANTTYVASYFAPSGHYSVTTEGLASGADNPPLHAVANSTSANGVFAYGTSSSFPNSSYNAGNYSVDVLFDPPGAPGPVTGVSATAGQASASVSWTAPSSGGPVTSYKVTPYIGSSAQTAKTITGSPPATNTTVTGLSAGTAYTFTVQASNSGGNGPESAQSNSVTPTGASAPGTPTGVTAQGDSKSASVRWTAPADEGGSSITGYTVTPFDGSTAQTPVQVGGSTTAAKVTGLTNGTAYTFKVAATNSAGTSAASAASAAVTPRASIFELSSPSTVDAGDPGSVNLGVKFTSDVAGSITGIRFYKAAANTGTHVGALWSASGTLLAQGTFSGELASGWQSVTFATPVPITAGTTYVASYLAPNGHYSLNGAGLTNPVDNSPLHTISDLASPNGVYVYGAQMAFPSSSFNAGNYWVDVLFAPSGA